MSRRKNKSEDSTQAPPTSAGASDASRSLYNAQPIPAQQWAQLTQQIPGWNQVTPMIVFPPSTGGSAAVGTVNYSGAAPANESNQYEMVPQMFPLPHMQYGNSPGNPSYATPGQDEYASSLRMLSSMSEGPSSNFNMDSGNVFSPGMVSSGMPTSTGSEGKNRRSGSTKRKKPDPKSTSTDQKEENNQSKGKRRRSDAPLPSVVETRLQDGVEDKKGKRMTSRYACVSWNRNARKWQAYLRIRGKRIHLGYYEEEDKAAEVVEQAKQRLQHTMEQGGQTEAPKTSKRSKSGQSTNSTPTNFGDEAAFSAQVSPATSSSGEATLIDPVQVMATFNYSSTGFSHALHSDDLTNI